MFREVPGCSEVFRILQTPLNDGHITPRALQSIKTGRFCSQSDYEFSYSLSVGVGAMLTEYILLHIFIAVCCLNPLGFNRSVEFENS